MRLLYPLLLLLPALCLAQPPAERPALVFGCTDFPPYCSTDAQGHPTGLLVELFTQLGEQAGLSLSFRMLPYPRLVQAVRAGEVQLVAGGEDNPLAALGAASRHLLFVSRLCLYPRPGLQGLAPVPGQRLLLIHGSLYPGREAQALLHDPALRWQKSHAPTHAAALGMLERGRADYLLGYEEVIAQLPVEAGQSRPACLPVQEVRMRYFVLERSPAASAALRDALDAAFSGLAAARRLPAWVASEPAEGR